MCIRDRAMTEHIYKSLSIPGFEAAAPAISQYIGGKKGYKKNKYKYDDRIILKPLLLRF